MAAGGAGPVKPCRPCLGPEAGHDRLAAREQGQGVVPVQALGSQETHLEEAWSGERTAAAVLPHPAPLGGASCQTAERTWQRNNPEWAGASIGRAAARCPAAKSRGEPCLNATRQPWRRPAGQTWHHHRVGLMRPARPGPWSQPSRRSGAAVREAAPNSPLPWPYANSRAAPASSPSLTAGRDAHFLPGLEKAGPELLVADLPIC